jgi:hypothetical protein
VLLQVLDNTALRLLPGFVKRPVREAWDRSFAALDHVTKRAAADLRGRFVRNSELDASGGKLGHVHACLGCCQDQA